MQEQQGRVGRRGARYTLHTYLGPTVGGAVKAMSYKNRRRQLGEERYPPLLFPCGKYVRIIAVPSLPSAHLDWMV